VEAEGAAGAGGIRQNAAQLMNAVRDMLNNIELAPAPRDNEEVDEGEWD